MLRDFFTQIQTIKQAMQPPTMPGAPGAGAPTPQASPQPTPTSPLVPNGPQQG